MRKKDYRALVAGIISFAALFLLLVGGSVPREVPVLLSAAACALSVLVFIRGARRPDLKDNQAFHLDLPVDNDGATHDPVMELVASIRSGQGNARGQLADIGRYPSLKKIIESRSIDEVCANIDSVYKSYESNGKVPKELLNRLLTDCMIFLPLANAVLAAVPGKTEEAAFVVMEKFLVVRESSSEAARKAKELRAEIEDTTSARSVQFTAERSRQAVKKERAVVNELSHTIKENRDHLTAMGHEIESGIDLLKNIEEITERSKLIAFNMSIEAARMGENGRGFKVIITELHRLNEKTFDFSRRVADLLNKFREYNTILVENIEQKSAEVIVEVEKGMDAAESSVESLIGASVRTQQFTQDIASMSEAIDHDLDGVLESLQFQDITRQMIEGGQAILAMLDRTIQECLANDGVAVDLAKKKARFESVKRKLVNEAKTKGEKNALMEVDV